MPRHWLGGASSQRCWWASVSVLFIRRDVPWDFFRESRAVLAAAWAKKTKRERDSQGLFLGDISSSTLVVTSVLQPLSVMGVETRGEMQLTKPRFPIFKLRRKVVKEKTL